MNTHTNLMRTKLGQEFNIHAYQFNVRNVCRDVRNIMSIYQSLGIVLG